MGLLNGSRSTCSKTNRTAYLPAKLNAHRDKRLIGSALTNCKDVLARDYLASVMLPNSLVVRS